MNSVDRIQLSLGSALAISISFIFRFCCDELLGVSPGKLLEVFTLFSVDCFIVVSYVYACQVPSISAQDHRSTDSAVLGKIEKAWRW